MSISSERRGKEIELMRIGRDVGHAPRRPDSPSPCIHPRAPSDPPPHEAPNKQRAYLVLMIV
eukprot:1144497-Pelagomonas_calceolata.AAC.1